MTMRNSLELSACVAGPGCAHCADSCGYTSKHNGSQHSRSVFRAVIVWQGIALSPLGTAVYLSGDHKL